MKESFSEFIQRNGLRYLDKTMPGRFMRVPAPGKTKGTDGWYKLFTDGKAGVAGCYGSREFFEVWSDGDIKTMSRQEQWEFNESVKKARAEAEQDRRKSYAKAAKNAQERFHAAKPATDHAYLGKKKIDSGEARQDFVDGRKALILPIRRLRDGFITSLQRIYEVRDSEGRDRKFLPGGEVSGNAIFIGISAGDLRGVKRIVICEGFATGQSIHMATGLPVLCGLNDAGLVKVAVKFRSMNRHAQIILAGDNDHQSDSNAGVAAVAMASEATGGIMACHALDIDGSDWNDVHVSCGLESVKSGIEDAIAAAETAGARPPFEWEKPCTVMFRDPVFGGGTMYRAGVWHFGANENHWLSGPIRVAETLTDVETGKFIFQLEAINQHGATVNFLLDGGKAAGPVNELAQAIADYGVKVARGNEARGMLASYIERAQGAQQHAAISMIGWHEKSYVLPDKTHGNSDVVFRGGQDYSGMYSTSGVAEKWEEVPKLCNGNYLMTFALCSAFAGALLKPCGAQSGGFHFVGSSSSGKSILLLIAASVLGDPSKIYRTWGATANGIEAVTDIHNDSLLILDEIGQCDAKNISNVQYMLANGVGKTRATRNGNARRVRRWDTFLLSTGELSIADKVEDNGDKFASGMGVRTIDLNVPIAGTVQVLHAMTGSKTFVQHIERLVKDNFGFAGEKFLNRLVLDVEAGRDFKGEFAAIKNSGVFSQVSDNAQLGRGADRFALVLLAGKLAQEYSALPADLDVADSVYQAFKSWVNDRADNPMDEIGRACNSLRDFLIAHREKGFTKYGTEQNITGNKRLGWINGNEWYLLSNALVDGIYGCDTKRKRTSTHVIEGLVKLGVIRGSDKSNDITIRDQNNGAPVKCYAVCYDKLLNEECFRVRAED